MTAPNASVPKSTPVRPSWTPEQALAVLLRLDDLVEIETGAEHLAEARDALQRILVRRGIVGRVPSTQHDQGGA